MPVTLAEDPSDGFELQAARTNDGAVRIIAVGRDNGTESYVGINLTPAEARAFARDILAAAGAGFERNAAMEVRNG